jgi:hypothetical protein
LGANPDFSKYLRLWGEAGMVKLKTKTTPNLGYHGVQCMMIGYALNHMGDTYRIWNKKTNGVHITRDIVWLKRMFFEAPTCTGVLDLAISPLVIDEVNLTFKMGESNNPMHTP